MPTMDELVEALMSNPEKFRQLFEEVLNTKTPATKETHIAFVLDSSGSMSSCRQATVDGYNRSVEDTKKNAHLGGDVYVTLVTFGEYDTAFNTIVKTKYTHEAIDKLESLSFEAYQPQGGTPMYDGILQAINELKKHDKAGDVAFLVNIFTDGHENASKTSGHELSAIIRELQAKGNWTFTVMGANIDLAELSDMLAVPMGNMQSYVPTPTGTARSWQSNASSSAKYMASRGIGGQSVADFYGVPDTNITVPPVPNTTAVPVFPTPTGKTSKSWEDVNRDEDDDNSLV